MSILPRCSIVTLLRYVSIELKELLTYLLTLGNLVSPVEFTPTLR